MKKNPINVHSLREQDETGDEQESELANACLDCIGIEHEQKKSSIRSRLPLHYQQRLLTGESVMVQAKSIDYDTGTIEAKINYEVLEYSNPSDVLSALRHKDQKTSSTGEMVVPIPIDRTDRKLRIDMPKHMGGLKEQPRLVIEELELFTEDNDEEDGNDDQPGAIGRVRLSEVFGLNNDKEYLYPSFNTVRESISEGDVFLLEPSPDDYVSDRTYHALQHPQYNGMFRFLESLIDGDISNQTSAFDMDAVQKFLEWLDSTPSASDYDVGITDGCDVNSPNEGQRGFIEDIARELVMLQGPPGTGKTSSATAPAIIARILAYDSDGPCRVLVSGASNKSINEVMDDVSNLARLYQADPETGDELDGLLLARISDPPADDDERKDNVVYSRTDGEDWSTAKMRGRLLKNQNQIEESPTIVFATGGRAWKVGKDIIPDFILDPNEVETDRFVQPDPPESELEKYGLFDMMVVDEASMMDVPLFLLVGMFYDQGGTIMLSGDHRQLPPVHETEWEKEYTPSIKSLAPHLSILNFCRVLKGEDVNVLSDSEEKLLDIEPVDVDLKLHRLEETYRCHQDVAAFLEKWVYKKLDGMKYESGETDTIEKPDCGTSGLETALDPESPLVLITYDDESSQQVNKLEAEIATEILTTIDSGENEESDSSHGDGDELGIVTPHNAQRGQLSTLLRQRSPGTAEKTDIDTVERFQGGEREVMLLSGTVSDPDYIAAEADFLLNLNRLNVAMSRMKKKLVVIASEAIFDHIPLDPDSYNESLLWKGLGEEAGVTEPDTATWDGTAKDFTGKEMPSLTNIDPDTVTVKVYKL